MTLATLVFFLVHCPVTTFVIKRKIYCNNLLCLLGAKKSKGAKWKLEKRINNKKELCTYLTSVWVRILILRKTDFGDERKVKRFTTEASEQAYRSRKWWQRSGIEVCLKTPISKGFISFEFFESALPFPLLYWYFLGSTHPPCKNMRIYGYGLRSPSPFRV